MEPLRFEPLIRQIRWGGRKLGTVLHKPIGESSDYAESWEVADQPGGQSVVSTGQLKGKSLTELVRLMPQQLLGRHQNLTQFPLLIKFLDAHDWLSLQVHPNDQQAKTYNPDENGKTEAWIILDAAPGSQICAGLRSGVTSADFRRHLAAGTIEECLHMIPARAGDCVFVPAGTVHALGPGILLAEVQQQSNLTFRIYDWGRLGSDGKPRQIHVEESLACIDFNRGPVNPVNPVPLQTGVHKVEELVCCEHFVIHRHTSDSPFCLESDNRFHILMMLEGEADVSTNEGQVTLTKGETVLLPADSSAATVQPAGPVTLLEILYP